MNAYETALSLGITGDDETMFKTLVQYGLTRSPIKIGELLYMLSDRHMMVRLIRPTDTGEKWGGTLVNLILYVNSNGTPEQVEGVNKFFSHITNDRNTQFDTTNPNYSAAVYAMRLAFQDQTGMPTSADFDALSQLGGGYVAGTLDSFVAEHKEADSAVIKNLLQSQWATAQNDGGINTALAAGDRTGLVAALRAAANTLEAG